MSNSQNTMNVVKGVAGGMLAGMALGYAGKKMLDEKPKMKKKANKVVGAFGQILDTASYMLRQQNNKNKGNFFQVALYTGFIHNLKD